MARKPKAGPIRKSPRKTSPAKPKLHAKKASGQPKRKKGGKQTASGNTKMAGKEKLGKRKGKDLEDDSSSEVDDEEPPPKTMKTRVSRMKK